MPIYVTPVPFAHSCGRMVALEDLYKHTYYVILKMQLLFQGSPTLIHADTAEISSGRSDGQTDGFSSL